MRAKNPWLDIPASDYVDHMNRPEVAQHGVLNVLLRDELDRASPRAVLLLGCSTGNGLEHIDPAVTRRVVGFDINPTYLLNLEQRFPDRAFDLHLECVDLSTYEFGAETFDLAHAALIFEYLDWPAVLPGVVQALQPDGTLSVVLQLPSRSHPAVTPTPFASLKPLESIFRFVDPEEFVSHASALELRVDSRRTVPLPSGKAFEALEFKRA